MLQWCSEGDGRWFPKPRFLLLGCLKQLWDAKRYSYSKDVYMNLLQKVPWKMCWCFFHRSLPSCSCFNNLQWWAMCVVLSWKNTTLQKQCHSPTGSSFPMEISWSTFSCKFATLRHQWDCNKNWPVSIGLQNEVQGNEPYFHWFNEANWHTPGYTIYFYSIFTPFSSCFCSFKIWPLFFLGGKKRHGIALKVSFRIPRLQGRESKFPKGGSPTCPAYPAPTSKPICHGTGIKKSSKMCDFCCGTCANKNII